LKEVQTLTRVFSEADAMVVQRAPPATQALADIEGCADVALLKARVKPPREQAARARWEVLRTRVAEAQALRRAGKYREGRRIASGVVEEAKASGFRALEADAYKCLGSLEEGLGDLKAAEDALYRALWAAEAGRDDRVKARAAIHLGALLAKPHRRHVEANRWAEMAAAILERMRGDTPLEAALSSARGTIFHAEGRYPEALTHLERALALLHRIPEAKRDVLTTAVVYGSLGSTLSALGRHEEALLRRRQFLEMRQRHLGGAHPEVATAMVSVANSLQRLRRYEEAAAQYRQALAIQESALGPESPAAANTHNNLGALLIAQGSFEQALIHQERALAIKERFLGKKHAEVAATHNNLGEVLRAQERWEAARDHYRQALEIWSQTLGPDHPDVGVALQNLGEVSLAQHRFAEAIGYFEHALAVLEKAVGPQHPDVAFPLTGAGEASFGLGAAAKAVQLLERALRIREAARVPVGDLARTRFALARGLWKAAGDRERARLLAGQAKQGYAEAGKKHRRDLGRVEAWIARHGAR
jgi:serine/threonine-protein kinase